MLRASVIIPAYKAADFLDKAVLSALAQTETSIEIIIVDDGSPDATRDVASRFEKMDFRVRTIFLPENHGGAYAINRATDAARGQWIALLDSDDWYDPERLKKLIDAAESAGVDMVADNQLFFDAKASVVSRTAFPDKGESHIVDLDGFLKHTDPTVLFDYGQLKPIFRASFIRNNRMKYCEEFSHGYDYFALLDYFLAGGKALVSDEPLYYYLQPFGSISKKWEKSGRKRYPFERIKLFNDSYIKKYESKLTKAQLAALYRRGKRIEAMARMHQVRELVAAKNLLGAFWHILTAPIAFWPLFFKRLSARLAFICKRH